jgi:hypothetical protein
MHKSIKSNKEFKKSLTLILLSMLLAMSLMGSLEFATALSPYTGVIRITAEGTVEGTDKIQRNGNVYTLNGDISGSVEDGATFISIERDGVVFDGAGKTIRGINAGVAIGIRGRSDITIKNTQIVDFGTGVEIYNDFMTDSDNVVVSSSNTVIDNYFKTRYWSIALRGVKNFISGNTFNAGNGNGVEFRTDETTFINNRFIDCSLIYWEFKESNVISGNTINGKPLVVLEGQSNQVIDAAGQVILINCTDMMIQNVDVSGLNKPIQFVGVNHSLVTHCKGPIALGNSHNNTLIDNEFSKQGGTWQSAAVTISNSYNNTVTQNSIIGINCCGLIIDGSYNCIEKNNILSSSNSGFDNCAGITLGGSKNYVYENDITAEEIGLKLSGEYNAFFQNNIHLQQGRISIYLTDALYNHVLANNIQGTSEYTVCLVSSDSNNFVWNNFKNNTKVNEIHETYAMTFTNFSYYSEYNKWDNGKEGNYWSDYTGADADGDGVGETPYHVYENFTDNYPLTRPYDTSKIQVEFKEWNPPTTSIDPTEPPTETQTPAQPLDDFPMLPVVTVAGVVAAAGAALLWYFTKMPKTRIT